MEKRLARAGCRSAVAGGGATATGRFPWRSVAVAALALSLPAQGQDLAELDGTPPEFRELVADNVRGFLNELSARRRTTTMFANPQSVFAGVQENFVNTSTGALTFLVRDLVRVGGMPIVMGRVYDSTLERGADFGPGWKLTLLEELRRDGSRLLFTDASNAVHALDIDGDAVVPASPATAPVVSGWVYGGGTVVLESADGVRRRFERDGDAWRLVEVRHARGLVRFDWRDGAVGWVSSDRGWVRIARRSDGRVVSIVDDTGRAVGYSYDADGALAEVTDLGGGSWHLTYAGGRLASVTDPRTKVVLAAEWADDRVRRIRVLHRTTDFRYREGATTATNLLGWSTVYRFLETGITESITDRTGTTTEVAFDAAHRPAALWRDGTAVARIRYDDRGAPATLWTPQGETAFAHTDRGVAGATGAWNAEYGRDAHGRVVHAGDARGEREYRYADDGSLAGVDVDGVYTELRTDAAGAVEQASRDGRPLATYTYAADGRVSGIDYGGGTTAAFGYDARGLRTNARYAYGDVRIDAAMSYDAAGNLVRHALDPADGGATEQDYLIGDYNEVLRVRTGGSDGAARNLTFGYDAAGRLTDAGIGGRTATVEYDALDRATRVVVDGAPQFEAAYGAGDPDAALDADRRTGDVLVAWPVSPVFGTMDSVVHTRPRSAEFGIVAYSPALRTFEVRPDALAPDALLLAGLRARMVPLGADDPDPAPFAHDKPSSSLFVPPELVSVNCQLCTAAVFDIYLTVKPRSVHCPTTYSARVDGFCQTVLSGGDHAPVSFGVALPWLHSTAFGDGAVALQSNTSGYVDGTHAYREAKRYTLTHSVLCTCPSVFAAGSASQTFSVPGGSLCRPTCGADVNNPPTVSIQSASIPDDQISITLTGPGCTGDLEVKVTGSRTHDVATVSRAGPGSHTIDFKRDLIPEGQYEQVEATWRVHDELKPDDEFPYTFAALGTLTHTQYTTPSETHPSCAMGSNTSVYVTEERWSRSLGKWVTDCFDDEDEYTSTTFRERFREEVEENGSGRSTSFGDIQLDWTCPNDQPRPNDAEFGNVFRDVNAIRTACNNTSLGASTVAVDAQHENLRCGDTIFASGIGTKTVTDHCPVCDMTKIDHYVADGRCTGIPSLVSCQI